MHVIAHTCKQPPQAVISMAGYGLTGKRLQPARLRNLYGGLWRRLQGLIPLKSAPDGGSGPHLIHSSWAHPSPHPKLHLDRFSRFWRAYSRYRPCYSVCSNRMHPASAVMCPNNKHADNHVGNVSSCQKQKQLTNTESHHYFLSLYLLINFHNSLISSKYEIVITNNPSTCSMRHYTALWNT